MSAHATTADVVEAATWGRTQPPVAAVVVRSLGWHIVGVTAFAFAAIATAVVGPTFELRLVAATQLVVAVGASIAMPRNRVIPPLALVVVPAALGACLSAYLGPTLPGIGPATAACLVAGEIVAAACVLARKPRLGQALALACPVVVVPALVVLAERGIDGGLSTSTWGIGAAAVVADVLLVGARLGEAAAPHRHGVAQTIEAAVSRFVEIPRALFLFTTAERES